MTTKEVAVAQPLSGLQALPSTMRKLFGIGALLVGCACVFVVGFASPAPVHNAAHDTRHSAAFPCH
jgi:cobalt transporter subunit CbtB